MSESPRSGLLRWESGMMVAEAIKKAEDLECCGNCACYYIEGFKIGDCSPKMKS